jgi:cell volume regulation protein A
MLLALITAAVARPIASALATAGHGFSRAERTLLAGAGLRGAVPLILATFALIAGVPHGVELLNIVFLAVVASAALQGPIVHVLAKRLTVRAEHPAARGHGAENMGVRTHCRAPNAAPLWASMRKESL